MVDANRTDSRAVTVPLDGAHVDERGTSVTEVSLAGTSGAILRRGC